MKNSRFQYEYRKSSSKLHKKIGDCLRNSQIFKDHKIFQEYPVNKINMNFTSGREKFDWVILDLKVVIEAHGQHHYEPVQFGGISADIAIEKLIAQQDRDRIKKEAAVNAGFTYLEIPFTDIKYITEDYIYELIQENIIEAPDKEYSEEKKICKDWKSAYQSKKSWLEETGQAEANKRKAREIRKERYRRAKEYKKNAKK